MAKSHMISLLKEGSLSTKTGLNLSMLDPDLCVILIMVDFSKYSGNQRSEGEGESFTRTEWELEKF